MKEAPLLYVLWEIQLTGVCKIDIIGSYANLK